MQRFLLITSLVIAIAGSARAERVVWRAIHAEAPHYPDEAKRQHLTGSGIFEMHIRSDGTVERVTIIKSTGHSLLDHNAARIFQTWRFDPHFPIATLRAPVRYIDGPSRVDAEMTRPPAPGYTKLFTIFIPSAKP